jgi:hypothetical protein
MWWSIVYEVVILALTIALAPKPPTPKAAGITDFTLPTADQGRNVPALFGTCNITGANVVWYGALEVVPIKTHSLFSSQTTGYQYFMGIHLILGHGPHDSINSVRWDQKKTWVGSQTSSGQICMSNLDLFGGIVGGQGGIQGCFDIIMGTPSEPANPYLTSVLGTVPAFRGVVSAVWKTGAITATYTLPDFSTRVLTLAGCGYIGSTPYIKALEIECTRITQGWNIAGGCWYPTKAVINHTQAVLSPPTWTPTFLGAVFGAGVGSAFQTTVPVDPSITDYNLQTAGYLLIGTEWMQVTGVSTGTDGLGGTIFTGNLNVIRGVFGTTAGTSYPVNTTFQFYEVDVSNVNAMNAAHIVYQCLTDPFWGLGLSVSSIDDTQFRSAADTFFAENMGLCMQWVNAQTVEDFLKIVLNHCAANLVMTQGGLYRLIPIRGGYDISTLPSFDETDIKSLDQYQTQGWADEVNAVTLTYTDPSTARDTSITAQDIANIDLQGKVVNQQVNLQGIRDHTLAAAVIGRELSGRATPLVTVKFTMKRDAFAASSGGLFLFSWKSRNAVDLVMRITQISKGTLDDNTIKIEAVQDIYSLGLFNYQISTSIPTTVVLTPAQIAASLVPASNSGPTVISSTLTTPPSTPADGDRYIVPTGATGAWAGHAGMMAVWDASLVSGSAWVFLTIPPGTAIYDNGSSTYVTTNNVGAVIPATFAGFTDHVQIQVFGG